MIGQIVPEFYQIFQHLNEQFIIFIAKIVNPEPIELPLNSAFTNKYSKI
jgi:hypothetical protein